MDPNSYKAGESGSRIRPLARRSGHGFRSRRVLLGLLACLAAFLAFGCSGPEAAQEEEVATAQEEEVAIAQEEEVAKGTATLPNILFVLADDLDFASAQRMPQIRSELIEEGTSFEKAFVSHPVCCPSRATILTGLYDHNHNVLSNGPPDGGFQKFLSEGHEENTIATRLQEGGYRTAYFGKYLNHYPGDDPTHVPPGWDEWYGKLDEQKLYDYRINENGEEVSYGSEEEDFFTDVLSGQATNFVRHAAPDDRPFFAYVAPTAPHGPAIPAERHKGAFSAEEAPRPPSFDEEDVSDKVAPLGNIKRFSEEEASTIDAYYRQRLESMLAVDEMIASLIQELEAAGELEETFVFFTSDNGWFQGEHRVRSGKSRPYEEAARVPLFVRGPGVAPGSRVENLALNTDFAPTFANLAGVNFPADGRSLVPLLREEEPSSWRSAVLLERLDREESGEVDSGEVDSGEEGDAGKGKGAGKGKDKNKTEVDGAAKSDAGASPAKEGGGGGGAKGKGKGKTAPVRAPKAGAGGSPAFKAVRTQTHKYIEYDNGGKELYDLETDPYELDNIYESARPSLLEYLQSRLDALEGCTGVGCQEAEYAP